MPAPMTHFYSDLVDSKSGVAWQIIREWQRNGNWDIAYGRITKQCLQFDSPSSTGFEAYNAICHDDTDPTWCRLVDLDAIATIYRCSVKKLEEVLGKILQSVSGANACWKEGLPLPALRRDVFCNSFILTGSIPNVGTYKNPHRNLVYRWNNSGLPIPDEPALDFHNGSGASGIALDKNKPLDAPNNRARPRIALLPTREVFKKAMERAVIERGDRTYPEKMRAMPSATRVEVTDDLERILDGLRPIERPEVRPIEQMEQ